MNWPARVVRLVVVLLATLLAPSPVGAVEGAANLRHGSVYTYDQPAELSTVADNATERGPPTTYATLSGTVANASRRQFAWSSDALAFDFAVYDHDVLFVHTPGAAPATTEPTQLIGGDARLVSWSSAAANGGGPAIADSTIIARGGQGAMPDAGEIFSGSQGRTVGEAGQGVVHGSFRTTTAGELRAAGGSVEPDPEWNPTVGETNYQHVDVCPGGGSCAWSDLISNVPKNLRFGGKDHPFYGGYP